MATIRSKYLAESPVKGRSYNWTKIYSISEKGRSQMKEECEEVDRLMRSQLKYVLIVPKEGQIIWSFKTKKSWKQVPCHSKLIKRKDYPKEFSVLWGEVAPLGRPEGTVSNPPGEADLSYHEYMGLKPGQTCSRPWCGLCLGEKSRK